MSITANGYDEFTLQIFTIEYSSPNHSFLKGKKLELEDRWGLLHHGTTPSVLQLLENVKINLHYIHFATVQR